MKKPVVAFVFANGEASIRIEDEGDMDLACLLMEKVRKTINPNTPVGGVEIAGAAGHLTADELRAEFAAIADNLATWRTGCSTTTAENLPPEKCEECTVGLIEAIGRRVGRALSSKPTAPKPDVIPAILFDGFRVLKALDDKAAKRTSAENVADVLDTVVRLMRKDQEDSCAKRSFVIGTHCPVCGTESDGVCGCGRCSDTTPEQPA